MLCGCKDDVMGCYDSFEIGTASAFRPLASSRYWWICHVDVNIVDPGQLPFIPGPYGLLPGT